MTPHRPQTRPRNTTAGSTPSLPSSPSGLIDVAVAIPAHDEAQLVSACLRAVVQAIAHAQRVGLVEHGVVLLAAHRCSDETQSRARRALRCLPRHIEALIVKDEKPGPVGAVRHRLVTHAARHRWITPKAWVFSTDADSRVPIQWITEMVAAARPKRADAVAGLVALHGWHADEAARLAYERIIAAGLEGSGHHHVYAANLAVRLAAYDAVGGFPPAQHGEEREMLTALRAAGYRIATPHAPVVLTSARMPGRADHGLGALLAALTEQQEHPLPSLHKPVAG